jgi:hypothetical protein
MTVTKDWFPDEESKQVSKVENIRDKIPNYKTELELSDTDLDAIALLCNTFLTAVTVSNEAKQFGRAVTTWKNSVKHGTPTGTAAQASPSFASAALPVGATKGVVEQLRSWRIDWMRASGYTESIGDDLGILAVEGEVQLVETLVAALKYFVQGNYQTKFEFSRQGQDALRLEWRYAGTEIWQLGEIFTASPGIHTAVPQVAGQTVTIEYRCRLVHKNQLVGQWSSIYVVYVTP